MHSHVVDGADELRAVLHALHVLESGDHAARLPETWSGTAGQIAKSFNNVVSPRLATSGNGHRPHKTRPSETAEDAVGGRGAEILAALRVVKRGDAIVRLPLDWPGIVGKVADAFNDVVERNQRELARLSRVVGKEGKLKQRASLGDVTGFWRDSVNSINSLIEDLVHPSSEVACR